MFQTIKSTTEIKGKNEKKTKSKENQELIHLVCHPMNDAQEGYFMIFDGLVSVSKTPVLDEIVKTCTMTVPNEFSNCAKEKLYKNQVSPFDFVIVLEEYDVPIKIFAKYYENAKSKVVVKVDKGELTREYLYDLYNNIIELVKSKERKSNVNDVDKVFLSPKDIVDTWETEKASKIRGKTKSFSPIPKQRNFVNKNRDGQKNIKKVVVIILILAIVGFFIYKRYYNKTE